MGFNIKKAFKKSLFPKDSIKNLHRGGSAWKYVDKYVHDPFNKKVQDMMGIGALKDLAAGQEAQLNQMGEAAKLNAMQEMDNVTQFDDTEDPSFSGSSGRRKKRAGGSFSSGIGLNY